MIPRKNSPGFSKNKYKYISSKRESLGGAVERMGVSKTGLHGSLAAASILTEAVDRADFPHTGFSGFMQPVLEDSTLAKRAAEGTLTVKDVSKTVSVPFAFFGIKQSPFDKDSVVAGFEARLAIDRPEYNVGTGKFYEMGVIGKDVDVLISFEAKQKK